MAIQNQNHGVIDDQLLVEGYKIALKLELDLKDFEILSTLTIIKRALRKCHQSNILAQFTLNCKYERLKLKSFMR